MSNLVSVCFVTVLVSEQIKRTFCAKHTIGSGFILDAPVVLLVDVAQVEAHFSLFGDSANLDASPVNGLPQTYHRHKNHFGCTRCNS
jgi:hypothetical protein